MRSKHEGAGNDLPGSLDLRAASCDDLRKLLQYAIAATDREFDSALTVADGAALTEGDVTLALSAQSTCLRAVSALRKATREKNIAERTRQILKDARAALDS